jgi:hypothetical protein
LLENYGRVVLPLGSLPFRRSARDGFTPELQRDDPGILCLTEVSAFKKRVGVNPKARIFPDCAEEVRALPANSYEIVIALLISLVTVQACSPDKNALVAK